MNEDRKRILGMLAAGKISADEAEMLLDSTDAAPQPSAVNAAPSPSATWPTGPSAAGKPKFLYVKITGDDTMDVKVPLALVRSGLKLTSLIPPQAMEQISGSMREHGVSIDLNNLKPDDIEELIASLGEMEVDIKSADGDNIRVFCA